MILQRYSRKPLSAWVMEQEHFLSHSHSRGRAREHPSSGICGGLNHLNQTWPETQHVYGNRRYNRRRDCCISSTEDGLSLTVIRASQNLNFCLCCPLPSLLSVSLRSAVHILTVCDHCGMTMASHSNQRHSDFHSAKESKQSHSKNMIWFE